ncbi:MAG: DNA endonuclease SmrA [Gammaproteobacteria bacterium]|nr:DNA endonuclease SmrA [Gammaproteobacteria bacterium]NVK88124.1 DNA endonuclease SmrA [Gammaproteobacteria bacterium]
MSDKDSELFLDEFSDIKPLKQDKVRLTQDPQTSAESRRLRQQAATHVQRDLNYLVDTEVPLVEPEQLLEFRIDGLQTGVFKKLRQGKYTIEGHLDLHRHTVAEARSALYQFIQRSIKMECRTLLVTHGKGARSNPPARIKSYVNYWLQQVPEVMAFHSAQKQHGGTGSVYVLLKKSNNQRLVNREHYQ